MQPSMRSRRTPAQNVVAAFGIADDYAVQRHNSVLDTQGAGRRNVCGIEDWLRRYRILVPNGAERHAGERLTNLKTARDEGSHAVDPSLALVFRWPWGRMPRRPWQSWACILADALVIRNPSDGLCQGKVEMSPRWQSRNVPFLPGRVRSACYARAAGKRRRAMLASNPIEERPVGT